MRSSLAVVALFLACTAAVQAQGMLVPQDQGVAPLALTKQRVTATIEDQVATTAVEQTFQNPTDRALEATYIFPVPKGASVNKFAMWVDGKEVNGELLDANKAKGVYTDIVRRTQDPGLLEYIDGSLMRLRVFPVPAHGNQKVAVSFTCVVPQEGDAVEYFYPLHAHTKTTETLQEFSLTATIKSAHGVQNVYSPSHKVDVHRVNAHEVKVGFEKDHASFDKDFRLFYSSGDKDVSLTALTYRPVSDEDGHFMLLLSPRVELSAGHTIPRDLVLVLDTSSSMQGPKMEQARKALKHCLGQLRSEDRFAVINFATAVNHYREHLVDATSEQLQHAKHWVDKLEANGSTAINDALLAALALRSHDKGRTFTVVFFTDGQPTVGECDCDKIIKNVMERNTAQTRIFTFGVGDDVNATLLDQLAEKTRAVSTFVRPAEDIEEKAGNLYAKISHPVLADLKLSVGNGVHISEVYPQQLPDLFHGGQVIVLGRYTGHGAASVKLTGSVGKGTKEFVYETVFPKKTGEAKAFVEQLWARRKVGYLLDQIRANGEKKELVDEVTALAKKHGIATPYTSYLVAPDAAAPVVMRPAVPGAPPVQPQVTPHMLSMNSSAPVTYSAVVPQAPAPAAAPAMAAPDAAMAGAYAVRGLVDDSAGAAPQFYRANNQTRQVLDAARDALARGDKDGYQAGNVGVELSKQSEQLREGAQVEPSAVRQVLGRSCRQVSGAWVDEGFAEKTPTVSIKAMSAAYFRILEKHPEMKDVFQLGTRVVWVTPSGTALVLDPGDGKEKLSDKEIEKMFAAK